MKTVRKRNALPQNPRRKRVAAYARVSSGKDAMLESLSAQVSYYSDLIQRRIDWSFAGTYADEAATGTKSERPEFQRLLKDCRAGKIDLVITKSITRFARNTLTTLETVRELKQLGIDVYFEKENIHSISGDGELVLSILASYAQEESRSVSENCKWRIRKLFQEGKASGGKMLGYRSVSGKLTIVPEEAVIVRAIFEDYLSGMGTLAIAKKCHRLGIRVGRTAIFKMLRNEKYQGDLLLQKSFTVDHLTKRRVDNTGQLPQYYVENSHEAIIDRETFAIVQAEIERRSKLNRPKTPHPASYPYTGLIRCGQCGAGYRRRHAAAGSKYEKITWICNTFNTLGKDACASQQIPEDILNRIVSDIGCLDAVDAITVPGPYMLHFLMKTGDTATIEWQHRSRRESWTAEMRQAAREHTLNIYQQRRASNA